MTTRSQLIAALVLALPASPAPTPPPNGDGPGPGVGSAVPTFRPLHVTGPHAGGTACPVCVHGQRPSVAIWTRDAGLPQARELAVALDRVLDELGFQPAAGYVVYVPPPGSDAGAAAEELERAFAGVRLRRVFLTAAREANAGDVERYRIAGAGHARTTAIAYVNRTVTHQLVDLAPGRAADAFRAVFRANVPREEPYRETTVSLCAEDEPGRRVEFYGRVLDHTGRPLSKAAVVAYNTDRDGLYAPRGSDSRVPRLRGVAVTDDDGWYRFRTVLPGSYPGRDEPAHVHLTVTAPVHRVEHRTFWFDGDPLLTPAVRRGRDAETVVVSLTEREGGAPTFRHDVRLSGN